MIHDLFLRVNGFFKWLESIYHQYQPRSLWFLVATIILTTHFAACIGIRPVLIVVYTFLGLHITDFLKTPSRDEEIFTETNRLILQCYNTVYRFHQYLLSSKTQDNSIYAVILGILGIFPLMIMMMFTSFHECYSTSIILCILLLYKYTFQMGVQKTTQPVNLHVNPMSKNLLLSFCHVKRGITFDTNSGSPIDFSQKDDGQYTAEVKASFGEQSMSITSFQVTKTGDNITPNFIDLRLNIVQLRFYYQDKSLSNTPVTGIFRPITGSSIINFSSSTSENGIFELPCPQGHLSLEAKTIDNGKQVSLKQDAQVTQAEPATLETMNSKNVLTITVNQASNMILNDIQYTGSAAFLGDCSGSMSANDNIGKLRRTYSKLWADAKSSGCKTGIGFTVWDTSSYFCSKQWLSAHDDSTVQAWIPTIQARGGNDMRQAIENAIIEFKNADNMFIICDGDVSPFDINSWKQFRNLHPKIKFHFIAVGSSSSFEIMKQMAAIGNGGFTATNI